MLKNKASQLVDIAKQAVLKALALTEEETKALLGKLPLEQIGQKTAAEIEKVVTGLVSKLLEGSSEQVDESVRAEVVKMIVELNTTPRNVVSNLRYLNELVQATAPRNLTDLKSMRATLAQRLVTDAKERLAKGSEKETSRAAPVAKAKPSQSEVSAPAASATAIASKKSSKGSSASKHVE